VDRLLFLKLLNAIFTIICLYSEHLHGLGHIFPAGEHVLQDAGFHDLPGFDCVFFFPADYFDLVLLNKSASVLLYLIYALDNGFVCSCFPLREGAATGTLPKLYPESIEDFLKSAFSGR
jgi:hypothetical protein